LLPTGGQYYENKSDNSSAKTDNHRQIHASPPKVFWNRLSEYGIIIMLKTEVARDVFHVSTPCMVEIKVVCDCQLDKGAVVEFQLSNSWTILDSPSFTKEFQAENPGGSNYVEISAPESDNALFSMEIIKSHRTFPAGAARHGRLFRAKLIQGRVKAAEPLKILAANMTAPSFAGEEPVDIRVNGESPAEPLKLKVIPGSAESFRIILPSSAKPGEAVSCLLISLDSHDNLSRSRYDNLMVKEFYSGAILAKNLSFEGGTRVPIIFPEKGIYRACAQSAVSNAIIISGVPLRIYWGDIHIHTELSADARGVSPYDYARDVSGLDFAACADHWESMGAPGLEIAAEWARKANEPGKFVTFPGYERNPTALGGHHNIYFLGEDDFIKKARRFDPGNDGDEQRAALEWQKPDPETTMIIPHHTGIKFGPFTEGELGHGIDLAEAEYSGLRPTVEIYSMHGQSEQYDPQHVLAYEFNRMRGFERRCNTSLPGPYYVQDYWMKGVRCGIIASSDDHYGMGGRRHNGITAVFADTLARENIFNSIRNMNSYATTGERILVDFKVSGAGPGESLKLKTGDNIPLRLKVLGTAILLRVEILRYRFGADTRFMSVASLFPQPETMDKVIEIEDTFTGPCMYYARITQEPLEWPGMAWTSPVWMDNK